MIVLGLIIVEIGTVVATLAFDGKIVNDVMIKIMDKGYGINTDDFFEWYSNVTHASSKLGRILLFIPGVNLLCSGIHSKMIDRKLFNDEKLNEKLFPIPDECKEIYEKIDNDYDKMMFFYSISASADYLRNDTLPIVNERLLPISYSLDDVKKISEATNTSYVLGRVDGINTAIVGIPNSYDITSVSKIKYNDEPIKDYRLMQEDECENQKFVVYPINNDKEFSDIVDKCIDEIVKKREEERTKQKSADSYSFSLEHPLILKKTLGSRKK